MELSVATAIVESGIAVVTVAGEIDVYTVPQLRAALDTLIAQERNQVVVDLTRVDFLNSTGLGVLVGRLKTLQRRDGWMGIVASSERVLRVFSMTGLDKVFVIADSVDALLRVQPTSSEA